MSELSVLMPRTVCAKGNKPVVCLVNPTDRYRTFKKGTIIGNAQEVETLEETAQISENACSSRDMDIGSVETLEETAQIFGNAGSSQDMDTGSVENFKDIATASKSACS